MRLVVRYLRLELNLLSRELDENGISFGAEAKPVFVSPKTSAGGEPYKNGLFTY